MADIESASRSVAGPESQPALTTATVEFTAATDIGLAGRWRTGPTGGGRDVVSPAGDIHHGGTAGVADHPDRSRRQCRGAQEKLTAAKAHEAHTPRRGGAPDVVAARSIFQRRNEISHRRDQTAATLAGLTAGEEIEQLRQRLTGLRGVEAGCREQLSPGTAAESVLPI